MTKPTLLVLAAGMGSRYGGLKQIDPVGPSGEIVLDYSVFDAWRAGFGKVVFVIKPGLLEPLKEHFGSRLEGRMELDFAFQELSDLPSGFNVPADREKPWGTGHAVWAARDVIAEPFAAINADDFYGTNSFKVLGDYLRTDAVARGKTYCLVAFRLANTLSPHGSVSRGICTADANGCLTDVVERTKIEPVPSGGARFMGDAGNWQSLTGEEPASMNMWGFAPSVFDHLGTELATFLEERRTEPKSEFFMPSVVDALVKAGTCTCTMLTTDDKWFGMTYHEDRDKVMASIRALVDRGIYPEQLWQ